MNTFLKTKLNAIGRSLFSNHSATALCRGSEWNYTWNSHEPHCCKGATQALSRPAAIKAMEPVHGWESYATIDLFGFLLNPKRSEFPMKTRSTFRLLAQGCIALLMTWSACAGDVIAVIKSPSVVYRLKASNGAFLGQINPSGGVQSVGCDGETIAVLSNSGMISRYSADTGAFLGQIQPGSRCNDVQVSGGVIIARSAHTASRYSASTGAFLGQSQL